MTRRIVLLMPPLLMLGIERTHQIPVRPHARVQQWGCGVGPSPHQSWTYNATTSTFELSDPESAGHPPLCLTATEAVSGAYAAVEPCATGFSTGAKRVPARQRWAFDMDNATAGRYVTVSLQANSSLVLATLDFDIRLFDTAAAGGSQWWLTQFNATPPVSCTAEMRQTNPGSCICSCTQAQFEENACAAPALSPGAIVNKGTGWCADAGPWDDFPCDPAQPMAQENITSLPFCDSTRPRAERVADLVSRIPDSDLFSLLQTGGVPIISLRIPPWNWWNEALHGVQSHAPPIETTTVFPAPLTSAASCNASLWHAIGAAESVEARACYNARNAFLTDWSPNINIVKDPRWGRGAETPGECPALTSRYAIDYVRGMQGYPLWHGQDDYNEKQQETEAQPKLMHASSCLKHFFAYDGPEDWHNKTRFNFDAFVTAQDLADTYLPGFEAGSRPDLGAASGVMCSYNSINGVPACAHEDMLTSKLRDEWQFSGYVTSDCGAVECLGPSCSSGSQHCANTFPNDLPQFYACMNASGHNYSTSPSQIIADVFKAGMDIDCGGYVPKHLMKALADGTVTRGDMDTALTHLFDVLFRLGLFETEASQPLRKATPAVVGSDAHRQISLEAAVQGVVLLKNENRTLPLRMARSIDTLVVVGRDECKLGPYAAVPRPEDRDEHCTITAGLNSTTAATVRHVTNLSVACEQAVVTAEVSAIVAVLDTDCKGESMDRTTIGPDPVDSRALTHIAEQRAKGTCAASAAGTPFLLVVLGACATDLTVATEAFDAILFAGSGGERSGEAISRIVFGIDSPSGRLPITMYTQAITNTSLFDMGMRPRPQDSYPGRTYRFHTGPQVFPAFFGLSYTTFATTIDAGSIDTQPLSLKAINSDLRDESLHRFSAPRLINITVRVKNTGTRRASTAVLVFIAGPTAGSGGEPIRELVGLHKIWLDPFESTDVVFGLGAWELSSTDKSGTRRAIAGSWTVTAGDGLASLAVVVT